jgi:hypothetical protein
MSLVSEEEGGERDVRVRDGVNGEDSLRSDFPSHFLTPRQQRKVPTYHPSSVSVQEEEWGTNRPNLPRQLSSPRPPFLL